MRFAFPPYILTLSHWRHYTKVVRDLQSPGRGGAEKGVFRKG